MRPQRIDHLGLLPQQKIARPVLHQPAISKPIVVICMWTAP
jgi:hypothetical protein